MATFLIVDDSAFLRTKLKQLLENNGHKIIGEAEDGIDALKKFISLKPDIITLDIVMPKCDGLSALKKIFEVNPDQKVVMVSSVGVQEKVLQAIKAGAKHFILKPFQEDKVLNVMNKVLT